MMPQAYHEALMRRLGMIDELGRNQTALTQPQQPAAFNSGALDAGMQQAAQGQTAGSGSFKSFMDAISGQESGGSYGARNKDSGAMGKYQIMPANLGGTKSGWDYEALGRDVSVSQFMASPQIQEAVASAKLKSYYDKWGAAGAAVAWYAGPGAVGNYLKNPGAYTSPQGSYPSIAAYVNSVMGRM